jgi:hypothetical protein
LFQLTTAQPAANLSPDEKRELAELVLNDLDKVTRDHPIWQEMHRQIEQRATDLRQAYRDVRRVVQEQVRRVTVESIFPPDLIGLLVLQPTMRSR